jgi:hypothetical protein
MIIVTAEHPSLFDLWMTHRFQPRCISLLAGVPEQTIHNMMVYLPVSRNDAQKVLMKLSTLIHRECTLETVYVPIRDEEGNDDANTRETVESAESK